MNSDTPRTDAAELRDCDVYDDNASDSKELCGLVRVEFARTLERQNAELLATLKEIMAAVDSNTAAIIPSLTTQAREAIRRAEA